MGIGPWLRTHPLLIDAHVPPTNSRAQTARGNIALGFLKIMRRAQGAP